jgi:hypothetical protein
MKFQGDRTVTPLPRDKIEMKADADSSSRTGSGIPHQSKSARRLSFGSADCAGDKTRKGSFDGQTSPKHSSATATMLFYLHGSGDTSPLLAQQRMSLDGDDVKYMIGESQGVRPQRDS